MEVSIKGGSNGKIMHVSEKLRGQTDSVIVDEMTHISSREGYAFAIHCERALVAANTFEDVMHLTYTGNYKLQIDSITASREDVALSSSGQSVITILTGVTYTSGGDEIAPVNLNQGSASEVESVIYSGTTTIVTDKTNQKHLAEVAFQSGSRVPFKGALILNKNDSITISAKSLNIGDIVHAMINAYEVRSVI